MRCFAAGIQKGSHGLRSIASCPHLPHLKAVIAPAAIRCLIVCAQNDLKFATRGLTPPANREKMPTQHLLEKVRDVRSASYQ